MTAGFDVFVQLVIAAIRMHRRESRRPCHQCFAIALPPSLRPAIAAARCLPKDLRPRAQRDAVLRALGAGNAGFDGAMSSSQRVAVQRVGLPVVAPQALLLGVGLDQL